MNSYVVLKSAAQLTSGMQLHKLPTLLEGGAIVVWLELSEENYGKAKKAIKSKLLLPALSALQLL